MQWLSKLTCIGLMGLLAAGCTAGRREQQVRTASEVDAGFSSYWTAQVPIGARDRVESAHLVDDNLYVFTERGYVYALEAAHGLLRWGKPVTERDYTIYPPSHLQSADGPGPVLLVATDYTYVMDRYAGDVQLRMPTPVPPAGGGVGTEAGLVLGSVDGHLYAWHWCPGTGENLMQLWRLVVGSPVSSSLHLQPPDGLFFTTIEGAVVHCGAWDKSYRWVRSLGGSVLADPFVDTTGVYVASLNRSLYRLDRRSGAVLWRLRFDDELTDSPVQHAGLCYQYDDTNGLTAVDIATGKVRWQRADGLAFVTGDIDEAVIHTTAGTVEVVDTDTGETVRRIPIGAGRLVVGDRAEQAVFVLSPKGRIECLRPDGTPYLRQQEVAAIRANLSQPPAAANEAMAPPPPLPKREATDPFRSVYDQ